MPERFLILGGNSFYGKNFAELVRQRGDEVIELTRAEFTLGDLRKLEDLSDRIERDRPDYVVNFMAINLVAQSWDIPTAYCEVNIVHTTNLFEMLRVWSTAKYIHVSTPEVYGSTLTWVDEDHPFNPTTPYAVSRAAGDMMLKAYHKAYGFPMVITRTANIYGPGQQDYRIIPKALDFKKRGEVLSLHGKGESERSFIHIKDACEATYLVAKKGAIGETYHISTPKAHTIKEVVEMIGCEYKFAPDRLGKDRAYLLNSRKVRNLGWTDTISLEEGLCELSR